MNRLRMAGLVAGIILVVTLAVPQRGYADIFQVTPFISLRQEYNDNYGFSTVNADEEFISAVSPGLEIVADTERLSATLLGRLNFRYFWNNAYRNDTDQFYSGNIDYGLTSRWRVFANAGYVRDSQPDQEVRETGLVQTDRPRQTRSFGFGNRVITSETTQDSLSYQYTDNTYTGQPYYDDKIHVLEFGHTWNAGRFFQNVIGRFNLGYARGDYATSDVDSYWTTIGAEWAYDEFWSVVFNIGGRYTITDFLTVDSSTPFYPMPVQQTDRKFSGVGDLLLKYQGEFTTGSITALYDIRNAAGQGGTTQRAGISGALDRRFSENFFGTLSAGYFRNKTDQGLVALDPLNEKTLYVTPGVRYAFSPDLYFAVGYSYGRINYLSTDTAATQNILWARLYFQYPE